MIKVLEHSDMVRWKIICPECASLLQFGVKDVGECVIERFKFTTKKKFSDGIPEIVNAVTCPVCDREIMLMPGWKLKLERSAGL